MEDPVQTREGCGTNSNHGSVFTYNYAMEQASDLDIRHHWQQPTRTFVESREEVTTQPCEVESWLSSLQTSPRSMRRVQASLVSLGCCLIFRLEQTDIPRVATAYGTARRAAMRKKQTWAPVHVHMALTLRCGRHG